MMSFKGKLKKQAFIKIFVSYFEVKLRDKMTNLNKSFKSK